jgi:hypothetical protein
MSSLVTVYVKEGVGRLETSQLPTSLFSREKRNEGSGWKKKKKEEEVAVPTTRSTCQEQQHL